MPSWLASPAPALFRPAVSEPAPTIQATRGPTRPRRQRQRRRRRRSPGRSCQSNSTPSSRPSPSGSTGPITRRERGGGSRHASSTGRVAASVPARTAPSGSSSSSPGGTPPLAVAGRVANARDSSARQHHRVRTRRPKRVGPDGVVRRRNQRGGVVSPPPRRAPLTTDSFRRDRRVGGVRRSHRTAEGWAERVGDGEADVQYGLVWPDGTEERSVRSSKSEECGESEKSRLPPGQRTDTIPFSRRTPERHRSLRPHAPWPTAASRAAGPRRARRSRGQTRGWPSGRAAVQPRR